MFIDYLAVMLVNMGAGLAILSAYIYVRPARENRRSWAVGFFAVGLLGLLMSVPMVIMWPLPGGFNVAFGEPAIYLSVAFLAAAVTLALQWEPLIPAIYGVFGAIYAIVLGIRIDQLHLGSAPFAAMAGYVLTGLGGLLVLPSIQWRDKHALAIITAIILALAAILWLYIGYLAGWQHVLDFAKYLPPTMLVKH